MITFLNNTPAASDVAAACSVVLPAYAAARTAFLADGGSVSARIGGGDLAVRATAIATRPAQPISVHRGRMSASGLNGKTNGKGHRPRELPL